MTSFENARISDHAQFEMQRRNIDKELVFKVLAKPDSINPVREGRVVLHKTFIAEGRQKALLYRIFVDIDCVPPVVVTVYGTSKITKYENMQ